MDPDSRSYPDGKRDCRRHDREKGRNEEEARHCFGMFGDAPLDEETGRDRDRRHYLNKPGQ